MARDLTPAATLGLYGAGLSLVFLGALGVGRLVGPVGDAPPEHSTGTHSTGTHSTGTDGTSGEAR